jgi:hypothetical protein
VLTQLGEATLRDRERGALQAALARRPPAVFGVAAGTAAEPETAALLAVERVLAALA